jgi:hypothetical protein
MEELLNGGCPKHTYLNKDGRQKLAHPIIECREFRRLSQALQEKMRAEQPVVGDIAYNALPPPPPNPPPNAAQHGHQATTTQHLIEPRQQAVNEEAFLPPCDMGWPDLLSKLAVMVMMVIDNLVSPMISPR